MKPITDSPGRYLAVFVFAPILAYKAHKYKDPFIMIFAILLFVWDLYWIASSLPSKSIKDNQTEI